MFCSTCYTNKAGTMLPRNWIKSLRDFGVELTWIHWNRLGVRGAAGSDRILQCSVDPEVLLFMTAAVAHDELRLEQAATDWLSTYESLVSIDRLKAMIKHDQMLISTHIGSLLHKVLPSVSSQRWTSVMRLLAELPPEAPLSKPVAHVRQNSFKKNRLQTPEWIVDNNTLLQLRYLFGPSIRADVLYHALVVSNQNHTRDAVLSAPALEKALYYDRSAIYRMLENLTHANVLKVLPIASIDERHKAYCLSGTNQFFGHYARHSGERQSPLQTLPEAYYVRWMPLLAVQRDIHEFLVMYHKLIQKKSVDPQPLLKTRLHRLFDGITMHVRKALLPRSDFFSVAGPLQDVEISELTDRLSGVLKHILDFLSIPHGQRSRK